MNAQDDKITGAEQQRKDEKLWFSAKLDSSTIGCTEAGKNIPLSLIENQQCTLRKLKDNIRIDLLSRLSKHLRGRTGLPVFSSVSHTFYWEMTMPLRFFFCEKGRRPYLGLTCTRVKWLKATKTLVIIITNQINGCYPKNQDE